MVHMRRGGGCNKSKPLSLATVDVRVYPSCHTESCHVTPVPSWCCCKVASLPSLLAGLL